MRPGRDGNPRAGLAAGHAGEGRGTATSHSPELTITVIQTQQKTKKTLQIKY